MQKDGTFRRDTKKEEYWRKTINRWHQSGLNQAEFCRKENLKVNTFSSWKHVLQGRDLEVQIQPSKLTGPVAPKTKSFKHSFVEVELDALELDDARRTRTEVNQPDKLVAEFVDASKGRSLRIFQSAGTEAVAALIAAFSSTTVGGF